MDFHEANLFPIGLLLIKGGFRKKSQFEFNTSCCVLNTFEIWDCDTVDINKSIEIAK